MTGNIYSKCNKYLIERTRRIRTQIVVIPRLYKELFSGSMIPLSVLSLRIYVSIRTTTKPENIGRSEQGLYGKRLRVPRLTKLYVNA